MSSASATTTTLFNGSFATHKHTLFTSKPSLPPTNLTFPSNPSWVPIKTQYTSLSSSSFTPLVAQTHQPTLVDEVVEEDGELNWEEGKAGTEASLADWDGEGGEAEEGEEGDSYPEPPEEAKLFVGNLSYDVDSEKLANIFDKAGVVEVAEVIYNRQTDQSRGFGFVTMSTVEEAEKAVEMFNRYVSVPTVSHYGHHMSLNKTSNFIFHARELRAFFEWAWRAIEKGYYVPLLDGNPKSTDLWIETNDRLPNLDINGRLLTVNQAAPRGSRPELPPRVARPSFRAYVGNLAWEVDNARLKQIFGEHGEVVDARVICEMETGRSRGFGFVTMSNEAALEDAIDALDGQSLDGRVVKVKVAEERPRRTF
ncbi:hypothetical protein Scep_021140 [Stephania cephalantha]|uniref:RRM domain-containing protein n=1 Tax=Stephania cephalantha TaxID=152367 RepID=A0AAP0I166_9MAGN